MSGNWNRKKGWENKGKDRKRIGRGRDGKKIDRNNNREWEGLKI